MTTKPCTACGAETDVLALFPGDECLTCATPRMEREFATMTATDLARMWGAKV